MRSNSKELLICDVCSITNEANIAFVKKSKFNMTLCNKHYRQLLYRGKITDSSQQKRNQFEKNEYILYDEYAEICLYDRQGVEIARTKIDLDDVDKCKPYKWRFIYGYVITDIKRKKLYIHRLIMSPLHNLVVDHIDREPLNNLKSNLKICSVSENLHKKTKMRNNTSGVTGVSWAKNMNSWSARIQFQKENIHLGYFSDIEEAKKVRREAEQQYFGEFAPIHND